MFDLQNQEHKAKAYVMFSNEVSNEVSNSLFRCCICKVNLKGNQVKSSETTVSESLSSK